MEHKHEAIEKLAPLSDKYSYLVWGFHDNVSATTYKGPGLYTMVKGSSFNRSNHLDYFLNMWGYVFKLISGLKSAKIVILCQSK